MKRKLDPSNLSLDKTREGSIRRCGAIAVETATALQTLTGTSMHGRIREMFPDEFNQADKAADACPVTMGGAGDLDLLYWCAESLDARHIVETGVAYGWSSLALLLSLQHRTDAKLISTDLPYPERDNAPFVGCVVPAKLRNMWSLLRDADREALPEGLAQLPSFDMCHYDSDKSYYGRMWAYPRLWDALRPGGLFLSDDIGDNMAFWDFADIVACNATVTWCNGKYVGILKKPGQRDRSSTEP